MLSEDDMDILGKNMGDTLYFVDGYHGGVEGHMPDGAFEDIWMHWNDCRSGR